MFPELNMEELRENTILDTPIGSAGIRVIVERKEVGPVRVIRIERLQS